MDATRDSVVEFPRLEGVCLSRFFQSITTQEDNAAVASAKGLGVCSPPGAFTEHESFAKSRPASQAKGIATHSPKTGPQKIVEIRLEVDI